MSETPGCNPFTILPGGGATGTGAFGAEDAACPGKWPTFRVDAARDQRLTVSITDSALADVPMMPSAEAPEDPADPASTPYCFVVNGACLTEGATLYWSVAPGRSDYVTKKGRRVSDTTFEFDLQAADLAWPGVMVAEIHLSQRDGDVQRVVWVKRFYLEIEGNFSDQTNGQPLSISEIRMVMRDMCAGQNILLDDLAYSDKEIAYAIRSAVDYWNEAAPPVAPHTVTSFPYRHHWALGTSGLLLRRLAVAQLRNYWNYSAQGLTSIESKWQEYKAVGDTAWNEYREWVKHKKIQINFNRAMGVGRSR
jgi:hypothetical protein